MKASLSFVFFVFLPFLVVDATVATNTTSADAQHALSEPRHQEHLEDGQPPHDDSKATGEADGDYDYDYANYEDIDYAEVEEARQRFLDSWKGFFEKRTDYEDQSADDGVDGTEH